MCGLRRGAVTVAAALIDYDNVNVAAKTTRREKVIVIDYFLYTDMRLHCITALILLLLLNASSGNDI
jgi:hypothetical protein